MKDLPSRPTHDSLSAALCPHFPLDPRRLAVLAALVLAMIQARSVVLFQLVALVSLPGRDDSIYKRLKRFVQAQVPDLWLARFVLTHVHDQALLLILDRTNWKLGQHDLNILLLSVQWHGVAWPLGWTLLPHGGASSTAIRIALLERLHPLLSGRRVHLVADREFIGAAWFAGLKRLGCSPVIRLHADSRVDGMPVWALFKKMQAGEVRLWAQTMRVYGVSLRVLASTNQLGDTLYLAYQGQAGPALQRYARRWKAECLHQALKGRGFDLEATHLTHLDRVSTLLTVVALAYVWCCLVGEDREAREPSRPLTHGYPPKSLFRRGLDALRSLLTRPDTLPPSAWKHALHPFVP